MCWSQPKQVSISKVRDRDESFAARQFEPVVATLESIAPGVAIQQPGICSVATRGLSKYFGGDEALAAHISMLIEVDTACAIGIADGTFAATLAAEKHSIVPQGGSRAFLESKPISKLHDPNFCDLLRRLGIRTLGDLASLPKRDLVGRFGFEGERAHHLACGTEEELFHERDLPADLTVTAELDTSVERVDAAAFATKRLADDLHERLTARGLACSQVVIEAQTEAGDALQRTWRHDGAIRATKLSRISTNHGRASPRLPSMLQKWPPRGVLCNTLAAKSSMPACSKVRTVCGEETVSFQYGCRIVDRARFESLKSFAGRSRPSRQAPSLRMQRIRCADRWQHQVRCRAAQCSETVTIRYWATGLISGSSRLPRRKRVRSREDSTNVPQRE